MHGPQNVKRKLFWGCKKKCYGPLHPPQAVLLPLWSSSSSVYMRSGSYNHMLISTSNKCCGLHDTGHRGVNVNTPVGSELEASSAITTIRLPSILLQSRWDSTFIRPPTRSAVQPHTWQSLVNGVFLTRNNENINWKSHVLLSEMWVWLGDCSFGIQHIPQPVP
jgi:hypothetical protein